jgi:hypothetical protein
MALISFRFVRAVKVYPRLYPRGYLVSFRFSATVFPSGDNGRHRATPADWKPKNPRNTNLIRDNETRVQNRSVPFTRERSKVRSLVRPPRKPLFIGFLGEPQKSNRQYRAERDPRLVPRRSTGGRDTMGRQIERK